MATILEAKDDYNQLILTDQERHLIYKVRVALKDLPDDILRTLNTLVEQQRGSGCSKYRYLLYLG